MLKIISAKDIVLKVALENFESQLKNINSIQGFQIVNHEGTVFEVIGVVEIQEKAPLTLKKKGE